MRLCLAILTVMLLAPHAWADAQRDKKAREDYQRGAAAYDAGQFQTAYDMFKESFQLSHEPALLYNIASALQGLKRPHDAAEALRSYLRVAPSDPDRPNIETRIATLEEEQRILDRDRARLAPPPPPPQVAPAAHAPILTTMGTAPPPEHDHKTGVIVGAVIAGVAVVAGAVVLGVVLGNPQTQGFTTTELGAHPGTR